MWVTRSAPSRRVNPRVMVVLPAALSPTMPSMIGLCLIMVSPRIEWLPATGVGIVGVSLRAPLENSALPNVRGVDADQLFSGNASTVGHHPVGMAQFEAINSVAYTARV